MLSQIQQVILLHSPFQFVIVYNLRFRVYTDNVQNLAGGTLLKFAKKCPTTIGE